MKTSIQWNNLYYILILTVNTVLVFFIYLNSSDEIRLVRYECLSNCGGWADRLKGIMSAYGLALLSDKQFKIKIKIRHPCELEMFFEPNVVN